VSGALLLVVGAGVGVAQGIIAGADLEDPDGKVVGAAQFTEATGKVNVGVQAKDLEPGEHGIHFHEKGDCSSSDFKSAGEHFNPTDAKHGLENPEGPHAGDLPNMTVNEDGTAAYQATTGQVTLSEGKTSVFDSDGSALVLHEKADDQKTDPAGDSGDRVACGEIEKTSEEGLPKSGGIDGIVPLAGMLAVVFLGAGVFLWRRAFQS
jgi:Cu-Zn family superoxide dismutase